MCSTLIAFALAAAILFPSAALARLSYEPLTTEEGHRIIVVEGEFEFSDDLTGFAALVRSHQPQAIVFNSGGGNIVKAMELGRMIRSFGLNTFQIRGAECASACALAFLGGATRAAQPGSIGVHKSSFSNTAGVDAEAAVSAVQQMTAEVISYITEMGADPGLLELAYRYDSDDIRYLSRSEMERYRIVPGSSEPIQFGAARAVQPPPTSAPGEQDLFSIPQALSGLVRHPNAEPSEHAADLAILRNGTAVQIVSDAARWFGVSAGGLSGFLHHTWVRVDQYEHGSFEQRYIQIKSFKRYAESEAYARSSPLPVGVYLNSNGWFAIAIDEDYDRESAAQTLRALKQQGAVPSDSIMTSGNTYVRKVCCDSQQATR
jgi:hypothetical protein